MNFASPPDIISPASYPPSPESSRQDVPYPPTNPVQSGYQRTTYNQPLSNDSFLAGPSAENHDKAFEQAWNNTIANAGVSSPPVVSYPSTKEDAVTNTLGRFASRAQRAGNESGQVGSSHQAMDVNAFTKLLLTGERENVVPRDRVAQESFPMNNLVPVSESSSSADTASISQRSLFETVQPSVEEESPRSSYEAESKEVTQDRQTASTTDARKKPPPPKSRRGKPLRESTGEQEAKQNFNKFIDSLSMPASRTVSTENPVLRSPTAESGQTPELVGNTDANEQSVKRTPPAPPLARRKSQQVPGKPLLTRSSSSRYSVLSEYDAPPSPSATNTTFKAPPPPPSRRTTATNERRPSFDVKSVPEDGQFVTGASDSDLFNSEPRPGMARTPSYMKRNSPGLPPPIPPPRRGRGSSRSSVETQRPSMATLGLTDGGGSQRDSGDIDRTDILADLAALQREVDAARASAG